mgnify:FL=1
MVDSILSVDSITSGESIICLFFTGVVLRFGVMFADWCLAGWKGLFSFLKVHFQKPPKRT